MPAKRPSLEARLEGEKICLDLCAVGDMWAEESVEGANFIFPVIHHLKRCLLWAQRDTLQILYQFLLKSCNNIWKMKFSQIKRNEIDIAISPPTQNVYYECEPAHTSYSWCAINK